MIRIICSQIDPIPFESSDWFSISNLFISFLHLSGQIGERGGRLQPIWGENGGESLTSGAVEPPSTLFPILFLNWRVGRDLCRSASHSSLVLRCEQIVGRACQARVRQTAKWLARGQPESIAARPGSRRESHQTGDDAAQPVQVNHLLSL